MTDDIHSCGPFCTRPGCKAAEVESLPVVGRNPNAPPTLHTQAVVDGLKAEIERKSEAIQKLWKERDEDRAEVERLTRERDDALGAFRIVGNKLKSMDAEFAALKAGRSDVDEVMALADAMVRKSWAEGDRGHEYDAARSALRAKLEGRT